MTNDNSREASAFIFSERGCELHNKINCGEISANALMREVWQAAEARNEADNDRLRDLLKAGLAIISDITEARGYIESSTTIHILDCERALANTPSTKDGE